MLPGTVSPLEVAWVLIVGWGVVHHAAIYRGINCTLDDIEATGHPITPAALALLRNDAESEMDWTLFKAALTVMGLVSWFTPQRPMDLGDVMVAVILFGAVLWTRHRSEVRARRRERHLGTEPISGVGLVESIIRGGRR